MNWRKLGSLALFVLGTIVAFQNFFRVFAPGLSFVQRSYYFILGLAILFLSAGAFYVYRKEK